MMRPTVRAPRLLMALSLVVAIGAACGPEAGRTRGSGAGADLGNYPSGGRDNAQLHGETQGPPQIYFNTPNRVTPNGIGQRFK